MKKWWLFLANNRKDRHWKLGCFTNLYFSSMPASGSACSIASSKNSSKDGKNFKRFSALHASKLSDKKRKKTYAKAEKSITNT